MASTAYRYSALPSSHIRLAKITHQDGQNLHVTVEPFRLDDAPAFEALSYTWGPTTRENNEVNSLSPTPTALHQIYMDACPFSVTENLHDALCELSNMETAQFIWIDALCIDQSNFPERSSQVLLMGDIYATAQRVIVWLGKDATDLDDFLWVQNVCVSYLNTVPELPNPFDTDMLQRLGVSKERWLRYWESYNRFYRRHSWFYRLWVVQEFALPREVTIRCAHATLDWLGMGVITFFLSHQWSILRYSKMTRVWAVNNIMPFMIALRKSTQDGHGFADGSSMYLNSAGVLGVQTPEEHWYGYVNFLIQAIRGKEASDPRDMIYGTLGIAQRFLPDGVRNGVIPDYTKPIEEIYMSVSQLLLENIPTLALLSYVDHQGSRNFPSLPSWCPDFSRPKPAIELISQGTVSQGYRLFNASRIELGALRGVFRPPCQVLNSTLLVSGKRIDAVEEVCLPLEDVITPSGDLQLIFRLALSLDHLYPLTNQDRMEVLWRTMIINTSGAVLEEQSYPAEPIYSEYFINAIGRLSAIKLQSLPQEQRGWFLELYDSFRSSLVTLPLAEELVGSKFVNSNLTDLLNDSNNASHREREWDQTSVFSNKFILQVSRTSTNRTLIRTSRKLLGLAPVCTQPGDEVWILEGALVPFILHRCPDKEEYTVVGETYVHGIMNGEAFEIADFEESFTTVSIV
jgi:hypothetical protein